jgi:hypothetical protein
MHLLSGSTLRVPTYKPRRSITREISKYLDPEEIKHYRRHNGIHIAYSEENVSTQIQTRCIIQWRKREKERGRKKQGGEGKQKEK